MKQFKKILALALAIVLVVTAFAACGSGSGGSSGGGGGASTETGAEPGGSGGAESNEGRALNVQVSGDTGTLYPFAASGGFVGLMYAFYEPLWSYTLEGERYNVLATDWVEIDETHYQLTIRDDVTFSNGNPLTASDVLFSMTLNKDDPRFYLNVKAIDFDRTVVTGDYTMDVYYTQYDCSQEVAIESITILDEESFDLDVLSTQTIGTGPYVVTDYVVNSHVTCEAREDYWGGTPPIHDINFLVINEPAQIINALETGTVDLASNLPFNEADHIAELGYNTTIAPSKMGISALFSFNGPLASREARYAVCYAMNRDDMASIMYHGYSRPCSYPTSEYTLDYEERFSNMHDTYALTDPDERHDLAVQYAEQSGLTGQTLQIVTNGSEDYNNVAAVLQANLADIGVNSEITPLDSATYFTTLMDETTFDIALFYLVAPSYLATDIMASYPDFIPLGWHDADRDNYGQIMHQAMATSDPAARADLTYEGLQIFVDVCPWYALFEAETLRAENPDVGGTENYNIHNYDFQDLYWR